ncbi:hypothetical protein [Pelagibius sp. 7325]|uniref:c-type cytochrome n=1 Tax=Pelagibius sp. 7325 TaxID=3131994 RepID=UPI0030EC145B
MIVAALPHPERPLNLYGWLSMGWGGLTFVAVAVALCCPAMAQQAPSGAVSCSGCHASAGSGGPVASLADRPAEEIVTALLQYRSGERTATVMDRIAKGFSDDEIHAIAEWFAAGGEQSARRSQP